ncbi:hypothetical protein GD1_184 [Paraglaciecola Antarctic GD virus 1]|nr:hypothetical protein GD1_184 [Paraglaciecola Antarctic GD virus 1]
MSSEELKAEFRKLPYGDRFTKHILYCKNPTEEYFAELEDRLKKVHCGKPFAKFVSQYAKMANLGFAPTEKVYVNKEAEKQAMKRSKTIGKFNSLLKRFANKTDII